MSDAFQAAFILSGIAVCTFVAFYLMFGGKKNKSAAGQSLEQASEPISGQVPGSIPGSDTDQPTQDAGSTLTGEGDQQSAVESDLKNPTAKNNSADDPAAREKRIKFWTSIMEDTSQDLSTRLRVSELLTMVAQDFSRLDTLQEAVKKSGPQPLKEEEKQAQAGQTVQTDYAQAFEGFDFSAGTTTDASAEKLSHAEDWLKKTESFDQILKQVLDEKK